jgi:hypothetical protein
MPEQRRPEERNEFTPRERGLLMGDLWAHVRARDHLPADGPPEPEFRQEIEQYLVYSDDLENPTAFWEGFRHGVRAFVVELEVEIARRSKT